MMEDALLDWAATLFIGALVASWWRGTWVLLDIWFCGQPATAGLTTGDSFCFAGIPEDNEITLHRDSGGYSLIIGILATALGVMILWSGAWRPNVVVLDNHDKTSTHKIITVSTQTATLRLIAIYVLGIGACNVWRGVWYITDYFLMPDTNLGTNQWGEWPLASYWTSSLVGAAVCFFFGAGNSLLAPPGIFLLDGPGVNPPPIAVTLLSCYYSITLPAGTLPPEPSFPVMILDILVSFWIIPFFVVWYWRGSWLVLDYYLYGFSPHNQDVWNSIGWSALMALLLMTMASETTFSYIQTHNMIILGVLGRLRNYLLAWGVVNYWRAIWYIWDELAGTTQWSCWVCHLVPLGILIAMGCMSCILAPASTMGVDMVPHPDCADEPLFSFLPCPSDDLYLGAIFRNPKVLDEQEELPKQTLDCKKSFVKFSILEFSDMIDVDDHIAAQKKNRKEVEMTPQQTLSANNTDTTIPEEEAAMPQPVNVEAGISITDGAGFKSASSFPDAAFLQSGIFSSAAADEEAEMEAAWAKMEEKMGKGSAHKQVLHASTAWASGGTGSRASYSSARTKAEAKELSPSYFNLQRADLDRRVSRRESTGFVSVTDSNGVGGSIRRSTNSGGAPGSASFRRTSELFRSR